MRALIEYPLPFDETRRQAALDRYDIVDTAPERAFDSIVRLASAFLGMPVSLVSFVDRERQWVKAREGIDLIETPREHAFCAHTICADGVTVVDDAAADPRFATNPLVIGEPGIRFYAGAPLVSPDDQKIGALCVIDRRPRTLDTRGRKVLEDLAALIGDQLELRRKSRELNSQKRLMEQAAQLTGIGAWGVDVGGVQMTWSAEVFRIHELEGEVPPDFERAMEFFVPEARDRLAAAIGRAIHAGLTIDEELPFVTAKGRRRTVRVIGEVDRVPGHTDRIVGVIQDVTERREIERRVEHLAYHDALTGLANRTRFNERLREATEPRPDRDPRPFALLQLDLDHFKAVNDGLGHDAGDALLRVVADRVVSCVGSTDTVARLGGDEFSVLLACDAQGALAEQTADRIRDAVMRPFQYMGHVITPGTSVGISCFPADGTAPDELLKNADLALYRAKSDGRNGWARFVPAMRASVDRHRAVEHELRSALERGELVAYYQPRVRLTDGVIVGLEALLRWRHPERGLVAPSEFIDVAEESGLILAIGEEVLRQAAHQGAAWLAQGLEFGRIAVNVAAAQFQRGDLDRVVLGTLAAAGLSPNCLSIEVVEGVLLGRRRDRIGEMITALHDAGIAIELDDFGTGYASLTQLKRFPVDGLKIDRSFVRDIGHDLQDDAIVSMIVTLGRTLGIGIVAEGVETLAQRTFLIDQGCQQAQGYLFSRAVPASRVASLLRRRTLAPIPTPAERASGTSMVQQRHLSVAT